MILCLSKGRSVQGMYIGTKKTRLLSRIKDTWTFIHCGFFHTLVYVWNFTLQVNFLKKENVKQPLGEVFQMTLSSNAHLI